jgi:NTE family protein
VSRALVLGGGGLTGIAWETGVLMGLGDRGLDVGRWDAVVGTSAGAIVGARLLADGSPQPLFDLLLADDPLARRRQLQEVTGSLAIHLAEASRRPGLGWLDEAGVLAIILRAVLRTRDPRALPLISAIARSRTRGADPAAAIAAYARLARTVRTSASAWIEAWSRMLGETSGWPAGLVVTAVDIDDLERLTLDAGSRVPLPTAIAASTAIAGLLPTIPVLGHACVDGGTISTTNADLAHGHDEVLVVAPIVRTGSGEPSRAPSEIGLIVPSPAASAVLGRALGRLDPARVAASARIGRDDGREWARRLSP